jgi:hypothetical protein
MISILAVTGAIQAGVLALDNNLTSKAKVS